MGFNKTGGYSGPEAPRPIEKAHTGQSGRSFTGAQAGASAQTPPKTTGSHQPATPSTPPASSGSSTGSEGK